MCLLHLLVLCLSWENFFEILVRVGVALRQFEFEWATSWQFELAALPQFELESLCDSSGSGEETMTEFELIIRVESSSARTINYHAATS